MHFTLSLQSNKVCSLSDFYFGQIIDMFTKTKATTKNKANAKFKTQKSEHFMYHLTKIF